MTLIAPTLQAFFTDRLARQRQASPRTIAAYRDALRLLEKALALTTPVTARPGRYHPTDTVPAFLDRL
ncbi:hypothetical protein OG279_37390 (plasmid) [Streptomyces sp. NBC_01201]|uniref:hypothetical protein n=1 Tax=Streptomyces sp. NBC_01201 TaxID=2903770 RepID=UPI002E0D44CD|nr:hypothetical protein OG279_37390 [Streptomyces sp. NBC_01201]